MATSEDICDTLVVMLDQEMRVYALPDYLGDEWHHHGHDGVIETHPLSAKAKPQIKQAHSVCRCPHSRQAKEQWRTIICDWCYTVVDFFDYEREIVSVAIYYIDKVDKNLDCQLKNSRMLELIAVTALNLAIKLTLTEGLRHEFLAYITSHNDISKGQIVETEKFMLESLDWCVHPPTPLLFCNYICFLASIKQDAFSIAQYLIELSVCDSWFVARRSSSVAVAAIFCSVQMSGQDSMGIEGKIKGQPFQNNINWEEVTSCRVRLGGMYDECSSYDGTA